MAKEFFGFELLSLVAQMVHTCGGERRSFTFVVDLNHLWSSESSDEKVIAMPVCCPNCGERADYPLKQTWK